MSFSAQHKSRTLMPVALTLGSEVTLKKFSEWTFSFGRLRNAEVALYFHLKVFSDVTCHVPKAGWTNSDSLE